jgi:hypothetical protein
MLVKSALTFLIMALDQITKLPTYFISVLTRKSLIHQASTLVSPQVESPALVDSPVISLKKKYPAKKTPKSMRPALAVTVAPAIAKPPTRRTVTLKKITPKSSLTEKALMIGSSRPNEDVPPLVSLSPFAPPRSKSSIIPVDHVQKKKIKVISGFTMKMSERKILRLHDAKNESESKSDGISSSPPLCKHVTDDSFSVYVNGKS